MGHKSERRELRPAGYEKDADPLFDLWSLLNIAVYLAISQRHWHSVGVCTLALPVYYTCSRTDT